MNKDQQHSRDYVQIIIEDNLNLIVAEETIEHEHTYIKRNYEFDDGAIVCYEWQDFPFTQTSDMELFNHKFTLVTPPSPNPDGLKPGVLKKIDFPRR